MSKVLYEKLLASFSKANTLRKQKIFSDNGFETAAEYKRFLQDKINGTTGVVIDVPVTVGRPTIHIVDVLDRSGSMVGAKIEAAMKGINQGIKKLTEETSVNHTYSLIKFDTKVDVVHLKQDPNTVKEVFFRVGDMTALNDAIGKAIELFQNTTDKVLINVYTDGAENMSRKYTREAIKTLIESVKDHITVTFIGTEDDVRKVVSTMSIDLSNTLSYDGTGKGLEKSITATLESRVKYSANVAAGNDVRTGFYKEIVNK